MFGSNRAKLNKIDKLEKRGIELARHVRDLNEENNYLYEENKDLRCENEELRDLLNEFEEISRTQQFNSIINMQNKIKSILQTAKSL